MASKKKVLLIDRLLNEGWFENAKQAEAWIMERKVLVKNDLAYSGKILVSPTDPIRVKDYEKSKYASRGGYKLEGALKAFHIAMEGKVVLDCGASRGGSPTACCRTARRAYMRLTWDTARLRARYRPTPVW